MATKTESKGTAKLAPSRLKASMAEIALVRVMRAHAHLVRMLDSLYRAHELSGAQYNVLRILEGAGEPLPQQEIAKRLIVSRANVTGLLDRLEEKDLIERTPCEDRRVNMTHLTRKGLRLLEDSFDQVTRNSKAIMGRLTDAEQRELVRLLDKLKGA